LSLADIKLLYVTATASWAVIHGILWTMFLSPTFCNMFLPLNSKALQMVDADRYKIPEWVMQLWKYAEDATQLELKGKRLAWMSNHWTGPNDETYTMVATHYISDKGVPRWHLWSKYLQRHHGGASQIQRQNYDSHGHCW
jgi:hypothetical protein